jgi:hypothetical protein
MRAFCPAAFANGPAKSLKFREIAFRACVMTGKGRKPRARGEVKSPPGLRVDGRRARNVATRQVSTGPLPAATFATGLYCLYFPQVRGSR